MRLDVVPLNLDFDIAQSQAMSDDGNWVVYASLATSPPRAGFRRSRAGVVEAFPRDTGRSFPRLFSPSADGSSVLTSDGVLKIAPGQSAAEAVFNEEPQIPGVFPSLRHLTSDGRLALLALEQDGPSLGAIWNTETSETDRFLPPRGFEWAGGSFLSDSGELAVGTAAVRQPLIDRPFVRRKGEQARELRVVLDRFGDTSSNYYVIERVGGMSRDGKTILVFYSSPWYGDGAAIVTLPDWEPCPADINFDGVVDDGDFVLFVDAYLRLTTTDGDLTLDRMTDNADFVIFATAYNEFLCP